MITHYKDKIILSSLPLRERIAQLVIARGDRFDERLLDLGIGGIFLNNQKTEQNYQRIIERYQNNSRISLLVATDMEGYWNPFPFYKCKSFGKVVESNEARLLGIEQGEILRSLGFNLNFSPVVEVNNHVWPGRSFTGSVEEIKSKITGYLDGLRYKGIMATAKHYPGGNLIKNPHFFKVNYSLSLEDLGFFNQAITNNVEAIMTGHTIVSGTISSQGKPSTVSSEVISHLKKAFSGLIITDDLNMLGLRLFYFLNPGEMYVAALKAGNHILLDIGPKFQSSYNRIMKRIKSVERAIKNGELEDKIIDLAVNRLLTQKGYKVIN